MKYNVTKKIQEHYDLASPYYKELWGNHIHHGYWITGKESKEEAAQNLIELLITRGHLQPGSKVLDIGCGIGGTSIYLSEKYNCNVTGITISPIQVEMAATHASELHLKNRPKFFVDDANDISVSGTFDVLWSVEMISHLNNRDNLFKRAGELLKKGGRMFITDWFEDDTISTADRKKYIDPIERGMLVSLPTLTEYKSYLDKYGFRLIYYEDISDAVAKTWDITSEAVKNKALWKLARQHRKEFVEFLISFKAMRSGFKSGSFRYPVIILEKK